MKAVIIYLKGKNWIEGKPHWEQDLVPHRDYLIEMLGDRLITAGQFLDHTGGIVLANVVNMEEAIHIVKNDPAVLEGILDYKVHPWKALLGQFQEEG